MELHDLRKRREKQRDDRLPAHLARLKMLAGEDALNDLSAVPVDTFCAIAESTQVTKANKFVVANLPSIRERLQGPADEFRQLLRADHLCVGEREIGGDQSFHFVESCGPGTVSRLGPCPIEFFRPIFELGYRVNGYSPTGPEVIEKLNLLPGGVAFAVHDTDRLKDFPVSSDVRWPWPEKSFMLLPLWIDNKIRGALSFSRIEAASWTEGDVSNAFQFLAKVTSVMAKAIVLEMSALKLRDFYRNAPPVVPRLTERQQDVLARLIQGWLDQEIAEDLNISHSAIRKHVTAILQKTGFKDQKEVIAWAGNQVI